MSNQPALELEESPEITLPFYLALDHIADLPKEPARVNWLSQEKTPDAQTGDATTGWWVDSGWGMDQAEAAFKEADSPLQKIAGNSKKPLWLLLHFDYGVEWGKYSGDKMELAESAKLEWDFLQELRLFGPPGELYIWRTSPDKWSARLRLDPPGQVKLKNTRKENLGYQVDPAGPLPNVAGEMRFLWGEKLAPRTDKDGDRADWSAITEDRGAFMRLPFALHSHQTLPLRLLVRHYLAADPDSGLYHFTDLRLVDFEI